MLASLLSIIIAGAGAAPVLETHRTDQPPAGAPTRSATDDGVVMLRIYDMRDLASLLAASSGVDAGGTATGDENLEAVFSSLSSSMNIERHRLSAGIYTLITSRREHEEIGRMLGQLRSLYAESFLIEVCCYRVEAGAAPAVGAAADVSGKDVLRTVRLAAPLRAATRGQSITRHAYVGGWQPIVGSQVVGYESQMKSIDEGLVVQVQVGPADEGSAMLNVSGVLSAVSFIYVPRPGDGGSGRDLAIPVSQIRTIHAQTPVKFGQATVVTVLDGLDGADSIVVAATARMIGEKP